MKRMAGVGVLMATSSLPAIAKDDRSVFPKRGHYEQLSVSYATINIGLEHPFTLMHFSDTHFTAAYPHENETKQTLRKVRTQTFGGQQEQAFLDSLAWAKNHVDYLVHTGDLIDWQSEANFDLVKKYFGDQIFGTMGNHEFTPNMWLSKEKDSNDEKQRAKTRDQLSAVYPFDINIHSQVVHGVNFIGFDDVYATVTEQQSAFIKNEFKKGLPIILCMHVPFYTDNIFRANNKFWTTKKTYDFCKPITPSGEYEKQLNDPVTRDLIQFLKKQPLLKGILTGHLHITVEDQFSETCREYVIGGNYAFNVREVLFI